MRNYAKIAQKIIRTNCYLTLGTTSGAKPWVAPVYYGVDKGNTFYYISQMSSKHTRHILRHPRIAFAIFDSHLKEGTGNGIQGSGKAYLLKEEELTEAFRWYHTTFIPMKKESFTDKAPYRFFKIIPDRFYILDPDANVDKRIEVKLTRQLDNQ